MAEPAVLTGQALTDLIGGDRLQRLVDAFSRATGFSTCIVSLPGGEMLAWSRGLGSPDESCSHDGSCMAAMALKQALSDPDGSPRPQVTCGHGRLHGSVVINVGGVAEAALCVAGADDGGARTLEGALTFAEQTVDLICDLADLAARGMRDATDAARSSHAHRLLADAAMSFAAADTGDAALSVLRSQAQQAAPGSIVILVRDAEGDHLDVVSVDGISQGLLARASQLLGWNPAGRRFDVLPGFREAFSDARLNNRPGGLYELAAGLLPKLVADAVSRLIRLDRIWTIGIGDGRSCFGYVHFLCPRSAAPIDPALIEGLTHQCYLAMARIEARDQEAAADRQFRVLVSNVPGIIYRCEVESPWRISYMSEGVLDIAGRSREDFMSDRVRWADVVLPEDLPMVEGAVAEAVQAARMYEIEYRVVHSDGSVRWVHERGQAVENGDDQAVWLDGVIVDVTAKRRAEDALSDMRERHDVLVQNMAQGVVYHDASGQITDANPAASRVLGLSPDALLGRTSVDPRWCAIREDGTPYPGAEHPAMTALRTGREVRNTLMGIRKPGADSPTWITVDAVPWGGDGESNPQRVFACFTDITSQLESARALRESEFWLNESQRASQVGSYEWDLRTGVWRGSPSLDAIFGIGPDHERTIEVWSALIYEADRLEMLDYAAGLARHGGRFDREYRIVRPSDGALRWLYGRGEFDFDSEGRPVRMYGTILDITERHLAEEGVAGRDRLLQGVAAMTHVLISEVDLNLAMPRALQAIGSASGADRAYVFANEVEPGTGRLLMSQRWEWSAVGIETQIGNQEMVSLPYEEVAPELLGAMSERRVFHGRARELHERSRRILQDQGVVSLVIVPVVVADDLWGFIGFDDCRSERTWTETETAILQAAADAVGGAIGRRRLSDELEDRVRERTRELRVANEELEAFCYSVSHDLRAPLRAINGFSAILVEDHGADLSPDALGYLSRVRDSSSKMAHLIDGLLRLSRVTRAQLEPAAAEVSSTAEAVVSELRAAHPERQVYVEIEPGLNAVADAPLLRTLLSNLLGNAWKFTEGRAGATIRLSAEVVEGGRVFCVRDNGAGFDMRYSGKLFGAFQRMHTDTEYEGTGIGLAIVKRIIDRHGGRIWAESDVDAGAAFYFTLSP